jgi:hypothetical protein
MGQPYQIPNVKRGAIFADARTLAIAAALRDRKIF